MWWFIVSQPPFNYLNSKGVGGLFTTAPSIVNKGDLYSLKLLEDDEIEEWSRSDECVCFPNANPLCCNRDDVSPFPPLKCCTNGDAVLNFG